MKTFFDCIPCFVRQALEAVRIQTADEAKQEEVLREVLRAASEMDLRQSPPAMGYLIHRMVRERVGGDDPYREFKGRFNRLALSIYPALKNRVRAAANPLDTAVRLAIAGNVIDVAVGGVMSESLLHKAVEHALMCPFDGDVAGFEAAVHQATDILYLCDNAGEIVFDRLLIEELPAEKITVVVRGAPVINDATLEDAATAGLIEMVRVIDNGVDVPGTILGLCSLAFRERFEQADLVIAKGQGNYETLSEEPKDIFFVLKAKCPVIARDLGCHVGDLVLRRTSSAS